jgi:hypothetical protein
MAEAQAPCGFAVTATGAAALSCRLCPAFLAAARPGGVVIAARNLLLTIFAYCFRQRRFPARRSLGQSPFR